LKAATKMHKRHKKDWTTQVQSFLCLLCIFVVQPRAFPLQDIGGTLAFQGQDIIGGAAVIFKAPKRDLTGGAAAMMAIKRSSSRSNRSAQVARSDRPPAPPTTAVPTTTTTAPDRAEALNEQGTAHYDRGEFQQAAEAFRKSVS
jgi:hypothetical protein